MPRLCIGDLQCFQTFRNCCLFCAFSLIRNIYSGDAHDANYCKHSLNHHFQHWTHSVYQIYSVLNLLTIAVCFTHLAFTKFLLWWCASCQLWQTQFKLSFPTLPTLCIGDLQCFQSFQNGSFFFTSWLLRNFYYGDAHHANYGKHSLNNHFQHCAHSVYQIDSVLKLFEITVCFTHFAFYEISTPVVRIMLTKAK